MTPAPSSEPKAEAKAPVSAGGKGSLEVKSQTPGMSGRYLKMLEIALLRVSRYDFRSYEDGD